MLFLVIILIWVLYNMQAPLWTYILLVIGAMAFIADRVYKNKKDN